MAKKKKSKPKEAQPFVIPGSEKTVEYDRARSVLFDALHNSEVELKQTLKRLKVFKKELMLSDTVMTSVQMLNLILGIYFVFISLIHWS